ncbi:FliM/FliN family flagellar motor switch protein [Vibrio methylphosphonaticus]|uniref:FliM/FliN family flagellar motor switch protein n=1 Tax=Vibrio methylphosphonaticus TaxID=2946866 RepID=UPI002029E90E|nr:FliM/FliN family flagellar motor C-terminal domain-containing protein [Vibrio methylphosphonaticus]MCL9776500.1 FliM/FliN family flagellar motor C-terminal domain-containing protein [Vibrio methylphosphonaticus]
MASEHSLTLEHAQSLNIELLGKPIHRVKNKLEDEFRRSSHSLRQTIQSWLNSSDVDVTIQAITINSDRHQFQDFESISALQHEACGHLSVHLSSPLLIHLADQFYGASIERTTDERSASDLRLQERIAKLISTWIAPMEHWHSSATIPHQGMGIVATLAITYRHPTSGNMTANLTIQLDSGLVQTLVDELALTPNPHIANDFQHALQSTPVRLNVQLSQTQLPLTQVLRLQPDDILPINLLTSVPVHIGKERLFSGRVAEQDGQLVLILNNEKESNS